jgi:Cu(I)/Ag(I) efflux system membrane fusion protein
MKKILKNQQIRYGLFGILGLLLGWLIFHTPSKMPDTVASGKVEKTAEIWTCAMHPQIRMHEHGKCPICAMELIPLKQNSQLGVDPETIHLTKDAAQLANVQTTVVSHKHSEKELRLYGKVQADERLLQNQVTFIPGRIEKLMVNFTGESIQKGQKLAIVYSPEMVTAQQEMIEAVKTKLTQPEIYEAAKEKLRQWKLADKEIQALELSGKIQTNVDVVSNTSGIVMTRRVNTGDYVSQGSVLYEIADLSHVWILFDAYESDLPFVQKGDKVNFTVQALPGQTLSGSVMFIDPVIDPLNRVAKIRLEISNPGGKLKPEMFVTGILKSAPSQYKDNLVVPKTSVLWTGKRSIVYVKLPASAEPVFKMREVELGPMLGTDYVILSGLKDGEEIVTRGAFNVDAAAQLEGKPSMMSQEAGSTDGMIQPKTSTTTENSGVKAYQHLSVKVAGNCEQCKDRIENAAKSVIGVKSANWSPDSKILQLEIDESLTNSASIQQTIAKSGHDTENSKAPDDVYKKLPECCLYRK